MKVMLARLGRSREGAFDDRKRWLQRDSSKDTLQPNDLRR